jgi:hypothetical protein
MSTISPEGSTSSELEAIMHDQRGGSVRRVLVTHG